MLKLEKWPAGWGANKMLLLITGLVIFLGCHTIGYGPAAWKGGLTARLGVGGYKGVYSLLSLVGFVLLIIGYGQARLMPEVLWPSPAWTRHATVALLLPAMILLVATYVPNNAIKASLGHPMILSVKTWALAHLISNGTLVDLVLFGSFLTWGVLAFVVSRRRDRANPPEQRPVTLGATLVCVVAGSIVWAVFLMGGHKLLIGVSPWG
jgi:uncharacterized membrane protein